MIELRNRLLRDGYAVLAREHTSHLSTSDPWRLCTELFGTRPLVVERQPIRPVEGGASFASSTVFTPLHTDSQSLVGVAPDIQIMQCVRPAVVGGETLLVDAWQVVSQLRTASPELYGELFRTSRRIPFVFGDVFGPTLSKKRGRAVFTHSPRVLPEDRVGMALARVLDAVPRIRFRVEAGEILVVHNHRMLHGREAFSDHAREFSRVLAWFDEPIFAESDPEGPYAAQPPEEKLPEAVRMVIDMLSGTAPGVLARRYGVPEPVLYEERDRALAILLRENATPRSFPSSRS